MFLRIAYLCAYTGRAVKREILRYGSARTGATLFVTGANAVKLTRFILSMIIEYCTIDDFNQITKDIIDFWGSDRTLCLHHPYLVYEFGNTAFVIRDNGVVIAYFFGFFSQTENVGYVHLIGVREKYQKQGLGKLLYDNFIQISKSKGIKKIKAVTTPTNNKSINFHQKRIGMTLLGFPNQDGIKVIRGYSGLSEETVVFEKLI